MDEKPRNFWTDSLLGMALAFIGSVIGALLGAGFAALSELAGWLLILVLLAAAIGAVVVTYLGIAYILGGIVPSGTMLCVAGPLAIAIDIGLYYLVWSLRRRQ